MRAKIAGSMRDGKRHRLYGRARRLIPGGTQLLSKRPEMFLPEGWPSYYTRARGVEVVDLDDNTYVDMSIMGVGACILGYADPEVDGEVKAAIDKGSMCTLNAPEEVELAELLCELHPWAQMVRYARAGGEAMSVAVRIARAYTGRDKVAFCGYHGWTDWYLAANLGENDALDGHLMPGLNPRGVPRCLRGTALPFHYNRLDQLKAIVDANRGDLAAIVMEPQRDQPPEPGFLQAVREIATDIGAVLIFDEISSGFRLTCGGVHLLYGVEPDMAVFSKALGNGFPIAAVIGRRHVMDAAQKTFISSTYWSERIGPVAALATIRKYRAIGAERKLVSAGRRVLELWREGIRRHGLQARAEHDDMPPLPHLHYEYPNARAVQTLHCQVMLDRGVLDNCAFYATCAHTEAVLREYAGILDEVLAEVAAAVKAGEVQRRLRGAVGHGRLARPT